MSQAPTGSNLHPDEVDLILAKIRDDKAGRDYGFIAIYFDQERGAWVLSNPFIDPENRTLIDLDDLDGWIPAPIYEYQ